MVKKVKVLVIDDSLVFRETVARGIANDPMIEVVGTASDAFIARDKIIDLEPDVLTLDVEMPRMNGIDFLRRLMPQYPLPVVMVSSISSSVFDALDAGAVDFVSKPNASTEQGLERFIKELIVKIKIASVAKVGQHKLQNSRIPVVKTNQRDRVIAIGASTGGTEAVLEVIRAFPADMNAVLVVQHMPPVFTRLYAQRLNEVCAMTVKEAATGDEILPGRVLIAPGDYHMEVLQRGTSYFVNCRKGERVNGHCPSVDVLFHSVANKLGSKAIGLILTGMGYDGAKGILKMKQCGAMTIGQDESSSVVYGMPRVAYDIGAVLKQAPLKQIPELVAASLLGKR